MPIRRFAALFMALQLQWLAATAWAQPAIVVSKAPDDVAVTFYRDGTRRPDEAIELNLDDDESLLGGYAMIAETRTVTLPPGEVTVRFEGVASGIIPQSAIMFDSNLKEKNFDGRLLSQRGLIDAFTGQRVTIRRTDPKTGQQSNEPATIVSQPDALILKTAKGYEAVNCSGDMATLLYPNVPTDLTAKPTLSMLTRPDNPGGTMKITLAYLASNFDWQANYVGNFSPDGQSLLLEGWLTLASKDRTGFMGAEVSAVAGQVARDWPSEEEWEALEDERENDPYSEENIALNFTCWPQGRTTAGQPGGILFGPGTIPEKDAAFRVSLYGHGGGCGDEDCDNIIVTGSRIARNDALGDLKLYTLPFASDVPSRRMKQVRFLKQLKLKGETIYRGSYSGNSSSDPVLTFRFDNKKDKGAGEPLPKGQIALFQQTAAGRLLIGETSIDDQAVNQEVLIKLTDDYSYEPLELYVDEGAKGDDWVDITLSIENEHPWPVTTEIELSDNIDYDREYSLSKFSSPVRAKDGKYIWRTTIPADGKKSIKFRETMIERPVYDEYDE